MKTRKIKNGYIYTDNYGKEEHCKNIEELFSRILMHYEGKSIWFGGNSYGCVKVFYEPSTNFISPKEVDPV